MLLRNVKTVHIQQSQIMRTMEAVREFGKAGCECLVLWLGTTSAVDARIEDVWVPPQTSIRNESGVGYFVSSETMLEISRECQRRGIGLIAQVHSHPGRAYHSDADDRYAIVTTNGGFSLVVPNYGACQPHIPAWAVYRLCGRDWIEMNLSEVAATFIVGQKDGNRFGPGSTSAWA